MTPTLLEAVRAGLVLNDGGMGTLLMAAGLEQGACGELWNLSEPDIVRGLHHAYAEAGAQCITTNTFGGTTLALERHGCAGQVDEINRAGVELARAAFGGRAGYVLGDMGPFGGIMEPFGEVAASDVSAAFARQARVLVQSGADALIIETQSMLEETMLAIEAAKAAGAPCIIVSFAYNFNSTTGQMHTMMGVSPEQAAGAMADAGIDIIGLNCGAEVTVARAAEIVRRYADYCDLPIMAQPNAGQPEVVQGRLVYREAPADMAANIHLLAEAGARIIGGCCGTTPKHIELFAAALGKLGPLASRA